MRRANFAWQGLARDIGELFAANKQSDISKCLQDRDRFIVRNNNRSTIRFEYDDLFVPDRNPNDPARWVPVVPAQRREICQRHCDSDCQEHSTESNARQRPSWVALSCKQCRAGYPNNGGSQCPRKSLAPSQQGRRGHANRHTQSEPARNFEFSYHRRLAFGDAKYARRSERVIVDSWPLTAQSVPNVPVYGRRTKVIVEISNPEFFLQKLRRSNSYDPRARFERPTFANPWINEFEIIRWSINRRPRLRFNPELYLDVPDNGDLEDEI